MAKTVLFLCVEFSSHWTDEPATCTVDLKVDLMRIPPGYTCVCQPADVCWNKPLKQRTRHSWVKDLKCQLDTAYEYIFKLPPSKNVIGGVKAWDDITSATIANGVACVATNGTVDPELSESHDGVLERLETLAKRFRGNHHPEFDGDIDFSLGANSVLNMFTLWF
ncbi:unnamed protein product [Phytophthora fragariaefolia]|uniref:Unnamed protein product n=1 Tax=Phytophthora fragariaefolia TaxID=1490495 RepID=A0A9W6XVN8_9STRA|nr:unnamed protein product [Phytophthora fragariaefolia]